MALDVTNPDAIQNFKQIALKKGVDRDTVDAYVQSKIDERDKMLQGTPISSAVGNIPLVGGLVSGITKPLESAVIGTGRYALQAARELKGINDPMFAIESSRNKYLTSKEQAMRQGTALEKAQFIAQKPLTIASYALPMGGTTKAAMATGALRGATGAAGAAEDWTKPETVGQVVGGALTGSVFEGGLSYVGKKIGGVVGKARETLEKPLTDVEISSNLLDKIGKKSAAMYGKETPSVYRRAMEAGHDMNDLISRHTPANTPIQKMIEKGGVLDQKMATAEASIQSRLAQSGDKVVASIDDILKPLKSELSRLKSTVGYENEATKLAELISEYEKKFTTESIVEFGKRYGRGITAKEAIDIKRAADSKFGKAVLQDTEGTIRDQVEKVIGNELRGALKSKYPDIADALKIESEIYTLKPVLENAYSISQTQGSLIRKGGFDITQPLTWLDPFLQNERVSSTLASARGGKITVPTTAGVKRKVAEKVAGVGDIADRISEVYPQPQRAFVAGQAMKGQPVTSGEEGLPIDTAIGTKTDKQQVIDDAIIEQTGYQPLTIGGIVRAAGGDKNTYAFLKDIYDEQQKIRASFGEGKAPSATAQKDINLAKSGLRSLDDVQRILDKDPTVLTKQLVPNTWFSREFDSATVSAVEALLRARSGAAVPPEEVRRYASKFMPNFGDDAVTIKLKMERMRQNYQDILEGMNVANDNIFSQQ